MSEISASQVMTLRQQTGVSMMECKKALQEANGDSEKAVEILRKKGAAKAEKKSDRTTAEGVIATAGKAMVSVLCETDFVARNEDFVAFAQSIATTANEQGEAAAKEKFEEAKTEMFTRMGENISLGEVHVLSGETIGSYVHSNRKVGALVTLAGGDTETANDIAMHVTAMNPAVVSPDEVSEELVLKEKEIWKEQLAQEGKPAEIMEKIMMGKEKKFREEAALVKQAFVKDQEKTVEQYANAQNGTVTGFVRVEV